MPPRPRNDLPRLSGRRDAAAGRPGRETQTVFRRFFDLIERFDKPGGAPQPPAAKSHTPDERGGRK